MSYHAKDAGFSLIETLMAIFALALLMSAGGALLFSTVNSTKLVDAKLERLNKLEVMTAHLRADIGEAVPRLAQSIRIGQEPRSLYGGAPDIDSTVLGLIRSGWVNIESEDDRSELLAVEYEYENGVLLRRAYRNPDRTRQTPAYETVLIDGLQSLEVSFHATGQVADNWEFLLVDGSPLMPDSVTVEMTFESGDTLSQSFLVGGRV